MAVPRVTSIADSAPARPTLRDVARTAPPEGFVLCEIKERSARLDPLAILLKLNAQHGYFSLSREALRALGEPERIDLYYNPERHVIALKAGSRRTGFKAQRQGQGGAQFAARGAVRRYQLESFDAVEGVEQDRYLFFVLPRRGGER